MTTITVEPSALWKRLAAGVVDFLVMWWALWMPILVAVFGNIDGQARFMETSLAPHLPWAAPTLFLLFPFCLRDVIRGRSFGKWLTGV
ncbi:MAG TPA: hypothetical protein VMY39_01165, partial [Planctomycetota bacterium]|nr:hypothetical protein [Planctomycetota bacterium]